MKVGFIDYYLDEWHANNYPALIRECSGGRYTVGSAYAEIDAPDGMSNREWSEKYGIPLRESIEEVIRENDVLIVLSPDNPERHPALCDLPLRSGKRVYVDKTFAVDARTAREIFAIAEESRTPVCSSSALRFASELAPLRDTEVCRVYTEGPGLYDNYSIHQLEQIVSLIPSRPTRLMFTGDENFPAMTIEFEDGRRAQLLHRNNDAYSFRTIVSDVHNHATVAEIKSNFFRLFIEALIGYFDSGELLATHEETVNVIALREAGLRAMKTPFVWETVG